MLNAPLTSLPVDAELLPELLNYLPAERPDSAELIRLSRLNLPTAEDLLRERDLVHRGHLINVNDSEIEVSIFSTSTHSVRGPGILFVHGGGMIGRNRYADVQIALDWAESFDIVVATVEYRLAPEHPDPAGREDVYAALSWLQENAAGLGIDPAQILICGVSAGGGLAAGATLMWRDRGRQPLLGQILVCPMLDDRNVVFDEAIDEIALWDHGANEMGWTALLGAARGTDLVSEYAAPARCSDLSNLPPTFIDVGSVDIFRDENIAYASRIWSAGGEAELHVWPGGFHAFDILAPDAALSRLATKSRTEWLSRLIRRPNRSLDSATD